MVEAVMTALNEIQQPGHWRPQAPAEHRVWGQTLNLSNTQRTVNPSNTQRCYDASMPSIALNYVDLEPSTQQHPKQHNSHGQPVAITTGCMMQYSVLH